MNTTAQLIFLYILLGLVLLNCVYWTLHLLSNLWSGVPTLSSSRAMRQRLLTLPYWQAGQRVTDLGCGSAKVLALLVRQYDIQGVGYEINVSAYLHACVRAFFVNRAQKKAGHQGRLKIYLRSLYRADLTATDVIFVYLLTGKMKTLSTFIEEHSRPGTVVISNTFRVPDLIPNKIYRFQKYEDIYVYRTPFQFSSNQTVETDHSS